jgi:LDH2 family malate/lactate/ureidoglycolate dehydrogenase
VKLLALINSASAIAASHTGYSRCGCNPYCGAIPAEDYSIAMMFDFVDPIGADRRSFEALTS